MSSYINYNLLNQINQDICNQLKTAFSKMDLIVQSGSNIISIPPIPPETSGSTIEIPLFGTSSTNVYIYENIDKIKKLSEPNTSSFAPPNTMIVKDENDETIELKELTSNQCLIIGIVNGIIRRLIKDNLLLHKWKYNEINKKTVSLPVHSENASNASVSVNFNLNSFINQPFSKINCVNVMFKETNKNVWNVCNNLKVNEENEEKILIVDIFYNLYDYNLYNEMFFNESYIPVDFDFKIFICYS